MTMIAGAWLWSVGFIWVPCDCGMAFADNWAAFEARMNEVGTDSAVYVPNPFPTTTAEIIADFEQVFVSTWEDL